MTESPIDWNESVKRAQQRAELLDVAKHIAAGLVQTDDWGVEDGADVARIAVSIARKLIGEVDETLVEALGIGGGE